MDSDLWSALETAAHPAKAFSGLSHGSFPVSHISHLPYMRFPLAVVVIASMLCPEQVELTRTSIIHCQNCTFLGGKEGSRASGRQQRRQMQESKLPCFMNTSPFCVLVLGRLCLQALLCAASGGVAAAVCKGRAPLCHWETFLMTLHYGWALWSWETGISFWKGSTLSMAARGRFLLP